MSTMYASIVGSLPTTRSTYVLYDSCLGFTKNAMIAVNSAELSTGKLVGGRGCKAER